MTKKEIEFILNDNAYLKKGTKESCIKVQDYVKIFSVWYNKKYK